MHSAYLLSTAVFLLPPILGRLAPIAIGVNPAKPEFFEQLLMGFHYGNLATSLIAFFIAWRAGRNGWPFVIAGLLTLLSSLLFEWPGGSAAWWSVYPRFAELPAGMLAVSASIFGAIVGWAGWTADRRPVPSASMA